MAHFSPKIHRIKDWIVGFVGAKMPAQLFLRALPLSIYGPENALISAFKDVVPLCGPTEPHNFPSTGTDVVIVSDRGIVCMDTNGTIRDGGEFLALGCGEQYAQGWWDAHDDNGPAEVAMIQLMTEAKHNFPGIGGETTVMRLEFP